MLFYYWQHSNIFKASQCKAKQTGIILLIENTKKTQTFMSFEKRPLIKQQLTSNSGERFKMNFSCATNRRPLFISQKLQLALGLSIWLYLFLLPWSNCAYYPPVDLYLISEKSIWNNWFLVFFELDFYCLCSLQKSITKLIFVA